MYGTEQATLNRETSGILIPDGTPVTLPADTPVRIAQTLGDTFTLVTPWGQMVRIEAKDADAIGKEAPGVDAEALGDTIEERVWAQMRTCYDPEIPVNIVDLGLIYDCTVREENGETVVSVKMTLTAPGCGMGQILADDVTRNVEALDGVDRAEVEVVFDPPWNPNMMTDAARLELGLV